MGRLGSANHIVHGCTGFSVSNVIKDRTMEQPGVLQDHGIRASQRTTLNLANITSVHIYGAIIHIVEPHQQIDDRCLASAGGSDNGG